MYIKSFWLQCAPRRAQVVGILFARPIFVQTLIMDNDMRAKVRAAVSLVAKEQAEMRGYSYFSIDEETLTIFKSTIYIREIEDENTRRSQRPTGSTVYSNRSPGDYALAGARPVDSRYDARLPTESSASANSGVEWPNVTNATSQQALRATGENEAHVHAPCAVDLTVPGQCTVHFSRVRRTEIRQYELGTEESILIVVHPGHPIAKHAAIGGAAGAVAGGAVGAVSGGVIGGLVGLIPSGIFLGIAYCFFGAVVGAGSCPVAIGGLGCAIGAARGVAERHERQFTITAKDVFRKLPNFREEGGSVYCQITVTHEWDEEQRETTEN